MNSTPARLQPPALEGKRMTKTRVLKLLRAATHGVLSTLGAFQAAHAAEFHHSQVPGYYRLQVGAFEVTALHDGGAPIDPHLLQNPSGDIGKVLRESLVDAGVMTISINEWLINTGKKLVLIDAGAGEWWGAPATGRMLSQLRAAGYTPEDIDVVLLTHLHTDHIGGLTTQSGKRVFANADIYAAKADSDFWASAEIEAHAPEAAKPQFAAARAVLAPYIAASKWHTFSAPSQIVDGITPVLVPGHSPGHAGYEISSQGQTLVIVGDLIHVAAVQFKHPEVSLLWDSDQQKATAERELLLKHFADDKTLIAGAHISFPGVGQVLKDGQSYAWVPIEFNDSPFKK
jgi:glyoxylase-like metal-dependent hydrolase (beta-lactamase superfamily II)